MSNKESWESQKVVNSYKDQKKLQKPEQTILDMLADDLKDYRMLDIGIGLGRTTHHFAPLVEEYVGIDYSASMIEACKREVEDLKGNISIREGNVLSMDEFQAGYFDLVLFSYNGIDYLKSPEDREAAFQSIRRVGKKGGIFVFSTHNLGYLDKLYAIRVRRRIPYTLYQIYSYFRLVWENGFPGKYKGRDYAIINDGAHKFGLKTFYIDPLYQKKQLEEMGFSNIRLFSLKEGSEIEVGDREKIKKNAWIYYVCTF
jgi:ubiquinone/menaquinone biosynthesis C-methylase UbiE